MEVWDLKGGRVFEYDRASKALISCFDPQKSLYLYEPSASLASPYYDGLSIPTVCTVSPDNRRYKEFEKNGGVRLYMPTWTLPELQAIRTFVANRTPEEMPFSEDAIVERFDEFGGIFRHVFARNVKSLRQQRQRVIFSLDPQNFLLDEIDQEQSHVSHFVAQYQVATEGSDAFTDAHIDAISHQVEKDIRFRFAKLDLNDKVLLLKKNDEIPTYMAAQSRHTYEEVIAKRLLQGVCWHRKNLKSGVQLFSEFKLELTKVVEGKPPVFADMEIGVLYRSLKENYPAVDMMFKNYEGIVYGIQVTRQQDLTRMIKATAVYKWLKTIGLEGKKEKVRIAVIPKPTLAEDFKAEYEGGDDGYPQLEVWKLPLDYSQQI
jgi:hypothetical protein